MDSGGKEEAKARLGPSHPSLAAMGPQHAPVSWGLSASSQVLWADPVLCFQGCVRGTMPASASPPSTPTPFQAAGHFHSRWAA